MDDSDRYVMVSSPTEDCSASSSMEITAEIGFRFSEKAMVNLIVSAVEEIIKLERIGEWCELISWEPQAEAWWDATPAVIRGEGKFVFREFFDGRELILDRDAIARGLVLLGQQMPEKLLEVVQGGYDMWAPLRFVEFALTGESVIG